MSTIFRNHMTADVLWVKVTLLSAYLQTKWRLKRTCFDGEIESQTRVPPLSSPTCDLSSVLRVNLFMGYSLEMPHVLKPRDTTRVRP